MRARRHAGVTPRSAPGSRRALADPVSLAVGGLALHAAGGTAPRAEERILCADEAPGLTRCWFQEVDDLGDPTHYTVDGSLNSEELWRGAQALAFFRTRTIVSMTIRMWCH